MHLPIQWLPCVNVPSTPYNELMPTRPVAQLLSLPSVFLAEPITLVNYCYVMKQRWMFAMTGAIPAQKYNDGSTNIRAHQHNYIF